MLCKKCEYVLGCNGIINEIPSTHIRENHFFTQVFIEFFGYIENL